MKLTCTNLKEESQMNYNDEAPTNNKIIMASSRPEISKVKRKRIVELGGGDGRKSAALITVRRKSSNNRSTNGSVLANGATGFINEQTRILNEKKKYIEKFEEISKISYNYFHAEDR